MTRRRARQCTRSISHGFHFALAYAIPEIDKGAFGSIFDV